MFKLSHTQRTFGHCIVIVVCLPCQIVTTLVMSIISAVTLLYYIPLAAVALHIQLEEDDEDYYSSYSYEDYSDDEERNTSVSNDNLLN